VTTSFRQDGLEKLSKQQRALYDAVMGVSPPRTIVAAAKLIGIKPQTGHNYWSKIRSVLGYNPMAEAKALGKLPAQRNQYSPENESLRRVMPETLRRLTEMRQEEVLRAMKGKAEEASISDLSRSAKYLNDIRAQLAGEPTQILSVDARLKMMSVLEVIHKEASTRGLVKVQSASGELASYKKLPATIDAEPSA
jgi:hypothetical protein